MPVDYRRVLEAQKLASRNGTAHTRDRQEEEMEVTRG